MGGSVTVAFRFPDGEIISQDRWTNALPFWFNDPKMFRGERAFIDEYLQHAESPGKMVPVAPQGYGIVLADFVTNTLFSMQGYTNLGTLEFITVMMQCRVGGDAVPIYEQLLLEKRISVQTMDTDVPEVSPLPMDVIDVASMLAYAREGEKTYRSAFKIDTSPLTLIDYGHCARHAQMMLDELDRIGFPLTDVDRAAWREYIDANSRE